MATLHETVSSCIISDVLGYLMTTVWTEEVIWPSNDTMDKEMFGNMRSLSIWRYFLSNLLQEPREITKVICQVNRFHGWDSKGIIINTSFTHLWCWWL